MMVHDVNPPPRPTSNEVTHTERTKHTDEESSLKLHDSLKSYYGAGADDGSKSHSLPPIVLVDEIRIEGNDTDRNDVSYWGLLRDNPNFRLFMLSSLATDLGEWFTYVASIAAIEQIHSSNQSMSRTSISILVALRLIPHALFSNIGGVLADSFDRRKILFLLDSLGAISAWLFLVAHRMESIPALYAATVLQMTAAALSSPSRGALVPMLISDENGLKKALTLSGLTWSVMASVGASIGGVATDYLGIDACFLIDGATYLLSAIFIWKIRGDYVAVERATLDSFADFGAAVEENHDSESKIVEEPSHLLSFADFYDMIVGGFTYLRSKPWGAFVMLKGCAALVYGAADVLNVAFSERGDSADDEIDLEGSSKRLGVLFAFVGVGCFLGPIIIDRFTRMESPKSLEGACLVSYMLMAFGCWGLARAKSFLWICVFTAVRSAGSSVVWIYSSVLIQKFCSNHMLGRVMAVDYALATLSEAISVMFGGLLQDKADLSPEDVSHIMAVVAAVTLVLWAVYFTVVRV